MRIALPALTLAAALALAGCGSSDSTTSTTSSTTAAAPSASTQAAGPVEVTSAWAKAAKAPGMSGVFGTVKNTSDKDVKITGVTSPASPEMQLHVTEKDASGTMVMKEASDGFTIKAGETFQLAPGANHIMFMKLSKDLLAGETVDVTLELSDGQKAAFSAQIREFTGAKETYAPSSGMSGTSGTHSMPSASASH